MKPADMLMCAAFALTLPAGQLLFKWAALAGGWTGRVRLAAAAGWYGLTALFWFLVLTRVPLSEAYPFAIAGSALVPLLAGLVFKEQLSWRYAGGYGLMLAGLFIAVRGAP